MSISESEKQTIENKRRCIAILKEAGETIVAEGLADQFDDALVDFIATARFIDKRLAGAATLQRIGSIVGK